MTNDYLAAIEQTVFYPVPDNGLFRISGEDRVDFLQRQSTNDINLLSSQQSITTVLTTSEARILDVLVLIDAGEEIWSISLPGKVSSTLDFLKRKIFFNDKVTLDAVSKDWFQIEIDGKLAPDLLKSIGTNPLTKLSEITTLDIQGTQVYIFVRPGLTTNHGYTIIGQVDIISEVTQLLEEHGARQLSPSNREILRIEAGHGSPSAELTEDHTPLETRLDWAISNNKGCYTGQEIIARQINYDKITKRLSRLHLSSNVSPGMLVKAENKSVGEITSSAISPRLGPIALAVIRRPHFEPGTRLIVAAPHEDIQAAVQ